MQKIIINKIIQWIIGFIIAICLAKLVNVPVMLAVTCYSVGYLGAMLFEYLIYLYVVKGNK